MVIKQNAQDMNLGDGKLRIQVIKCQRWTSKEGKMGENNVLITSFLKNEVISTT